MLDDSTLERPESVEQILRDVVAYILNCETIIGHVSPGYNPKPRLKAAGDLLLIAEYMSLHPETDDAIMSLLTTFKL